MARPAVISLPGVRQQPTSLVAPLGTDWGGIDGLMRRQFEPVVAAPNPAAALPRERTWLRPTIAFSLLLPAAVFAASLGLRDLSTTDDTPAAAAKAASAATANAPAPASLAIQAETAKLQGLLNQFVAGSADSEQYGLVVMDLTNGAVASSAADTVMDSASLYKLFVAQRILAGVDAGTYSLSQSADDDLGHNISQCLNLMITVSDNNCGGALGNIIGWQNQNAALHSLGFAHTDLQTLQQTSASDVALWFEKLYRGQLLSPASTNLLLGLLKAQQVNNRLPAGLPAGTVIAHKTGDLYDAVHDAGIVYSGKTPYLVVIMSDHWRSVGNAPARFAQLSSQLYQQFNQ